MQRIPLTFYVRLRPFAVIALACLVIIVLTGCVKVRSAMIVNADGAGTVGIALGLNAQSRAWLGRGVDPIQAMVRQIKVNVRPEDVTRWTEGDYEYGEIRRRFSSVSEVSTLLADIKLFNRFSITREDNFFRQRFVLDAEAMSLEESWKSDDPSSSGPDPATFVEMQFAATLPGTIVENNGVIDAANPALSVWKLAPKNVTSVRMVTETWNGKNLTLLFGVACFLLALIGSVVLFVEFTRPARRRG